MAPDRSEFRALISALCAFANVTTSRHPAVNATVLDMITTDGEPSVQVETNILFRNLHRRLGNLPVAIGPSSEQPMASRESWRQFNQLRPRQRAALFLVVGAGFSAEDAAVVLDLTPQELSAEITAAVFCLEHVFPFSGARAKLETTQPCVVEM
jgi:hypothetical protein